MRTRLDSPITIQHVLTLVRAVRYGLVMKHKSWQLCDGIIGEIGNMLEADQPATPETEEGCDRCEAGPWDPCDRGVDHSTQAAPEPREATACEHDFGPVFCWKCGEEPETREACASEVAK